MERNRYGDLLRVVAIGGVVYGHWLLIDITYRGGVLSGEDALQHVSWSRWGTLVFQVMPVFFLVGGYVNAGSWLSRKPDYATWVRHRATRLLTPTAVYVAVAVLVVLAAQAAKAPAGEIGQAAALVALQLWFLPVYLLLIALTPVLLAAHERWGLAVPVVMACSAGLVDLAVLDAHLAFAGYANYLLVWGTMHQWGFAWRDGSLRGWRPYALALTGLAALIPLVTAGPFPVDMIGDGEPVTNTTPPSIALLAFAAVQAGLLLAIQPAVARVLHRPSRLNGYCITLYLWHMAPVIAVAVVFYPAGLLPQPPIGTAQWWALRPVWFALLTVVLIPVALVAKLADRGGSDRAASPLVLPGLLAAIIGLAQIAINGFAPGGQLPWTTLIILAAGLAAIYASRL